jgi:conjugative relaxase-like TrwC/TraI family protein
VGWDATINCPKSVSVQALVGGDTRVLDAFSRACDVAFQELEHFARARAGADRTSHHETRNLLSASFTHFENRLGEPHLHRHHVVFNTTWDPEAIDRGTKEKGGYRALESRGLFVAQEWITAVFRAELSSELVSLGYALTLDEKGAPQIAAVPKELCADFSTRRAEIEAKVAQLREKAERAGITWTKKMEAAAADSAAKETRSPKDHDQDFLTSHEKWRMICHAHAFDSEGVADEALLRSSDLAAHVQRAAQKDAAVKEAVTQAIEHWTERQCVFSERELAQHCFLQAQHLGSYTLSDIRRELLAQTEAGELVKGRNRQGDCYTTLELCCLEEKCLEVVRRGKGKMKPLGSEAAIDAAARSHDEEGRFLNAQQQEAFSFLCRSTDRVTSLHGRAGAGKSFVFRHLASHAKSEGFRVEAFAPTLSAVETLSAGGIPARTIQAHLRSGPVASASPTLWLVDEAGMLGLRDMEALLTRAERENARVVLAGDTRQFASVPAGRAYAQLLEDGLSSVNLQKITRQDQAEAHVREAVAEIASGEVRRGLERLRAGGRVYQSPDTEQRLKTIATLYTVLSGDTLIISATNRERQELNAAIRAARIETGELPREGLRTEVYLNKNITKASRKEARHYERGDRVRFAQVRHPGLETGIWYTVTSRDLLRNRVTVRTREGVSITYDPKRHYGIEDVFSVHERVFAVGDRVQLRSRSGGIAAGSIGTVTAVSERGDISLELTSGRVLDINLSDYRTLDYAYATTGHSAQSRTVDNAIVLQTSAHPETVVNSASAYVGTSRVRKELFVVVDDFEQAVAAMEREQEKTAALDLEAGHDTEKGLRDTPSQEPGLELRLSRELPRENGEQDANQVLPPRRPVE